MGVQAKGWNTEFDSELDTWNPLFLPIAITHEDGSLIGAAAIIFYAAFQHASLLSRFEDLQQEITKLKTVIATNQITAQAQSSGTLIPQVPTLDAANASGAASAATAAISALDSGSSSSSFSTFEAVASSFFPLLIVCATAFIVFYIVNEVQSVRKNWTKNGAPDIPAEEIISYRLDYWLSFSIWAKPFFLVGLIMLLVSVGGIVFALVTGEPLSGSMWQTWLLIVDTGAHGDFQPLLHRFVGLVMTCFGMIVFGFLVGIVTDVIGEKVDQLKKGRARVIETGHSLILNWSDKTLPIIAELCNANESLGGGTIVILADEPKEVLEQRVAEAEIQLLGSKVIVRSGSPIMQTDLRKVSAHQARSIVVLAREASVSPDESDAMTLRTVLSLKAMKLSGHIVCELRDIDNRDIIEIVGGSLVECIVAHDVIGRIMIQAAMQPGIALVLDRLLGFEGSEFYMKSWPELEGKTFRDIFFLFNDAIVMGIRKMRPDGSTQLILNPPRDLVLSAEDQVIVLAEDDDSYLPDLSRLHKSMEIFTDAQKSFAKHRLGKARSSTPTNLLFVGWRRDIDDMIAELDGYVAPGSNLTLFSEIPIDKRKRDLREGGLDVTGLKNLTIHNVVGSPLSRRHLSKKLDMAMFDSVLILADETYELDVQKMDSRSLTSLLLIRDINAKHERESVRKQIVQSLRAHGAVSTTPTLTTSTETDASSTSSSSSSTSSSSSSSAPPSSPPASPVNGKVTPTVTWPSASELRSRRRQQGGESNNNNSTGDAHDDADDSHEDAEGNEKVDDGDAKDGNGQNDMRGSPPKLIPRVNITSILPHDLTTSTSDSSSSSSSSSLAAAAAAAAGDSSSMTNTVPSRRRSETFTVDSDGLVQRRRSSNVIQASQEGLTVISEILDSRTKSLISMGGSSDYVASNELVSKAIAMVAEERQVGRLLQELLSADGNELYMRPALQFVEEFEVCTFNEIAARAFLRGEICIGFVKNLTRVSEEKEETDDTPVIVVGGSAGSSSASSRMSTKQAEDARVARVKGTWRRTSIGDSSIAQMFRAHNSSSPSSSFSSSSSSSSSENTSSTSSCAAEPSSLRKSPSLLNAMLPEISVVPTDGQDDDEEANDQIHINPTHKDEPYEWTSDDFIVTIACE